MHKKLAITVDAEVYDGLGAVIGLRRIGRFLNDLARQHAIAAGYAAMAVDEAREQKAEAWSEALISGIVAEPRRG